MVDACLAYGLKPFYGPFGDFSDSAACEAQFRNAFLQGCLGAWSLHPTQIDIAKRVFSPDVEEVAFAKRILEAMPDGTGAVMIDGKMQDDATWKQAKVIVDLARSSPPRIPRRAAAYGLYESGCGRNAALREPSLPRPIDSRDGLPSNGRGRSDRAARRWAR